MVDLEDQRLRPSSRPEKIEEYVADTHKKALAATEERRLRSERNWLFYLDKQDRWLDGGEVKSFWQNEHITYRTENVLAGAVETQVGRLVKDLPDVKAVPTTPDALARGAAQIAQRLLEYWSFEYDFARDDVRVALWGYLSGHAGWKVVYDPADDPTQPGRILFEPKRLWEVILDPDASEPKNRKWVTFRRHVSVFEAQALAEERANAGLVEGQQRRTFDASDFETCKYKPGVSDEEREGVEVQERWEIPHPQCPEGLFLLIVGGKLVEAQPFPYLLPSRSHGRNAVEPYLPYVSWSPKESDSGPFGATPVDSAVIAQRLHNETISRISHLTNISADIRRYGDGEILSKIRTGKNQDIECPDPSRIPRWEEGPRLSPALFAEKEEGPQRIRSLVGLDQDAHVTSSSDPAKKVAFVEQIDALKLAGPYRSFTAMLKERAELALKLAQTFFTSTVEASWPGETEADVNHLAFQGADLMGVTVRLEDTRGSDKYSEQKAQREAELAAAGLADPAGAALAARDGQRQSTLQAATERTVMAEIEEVAAGVQPRLEADPQLAIPMLRDAAQVFEQAGDLARVEAAETLAKAYAEALQANPPAQPQQDPRSGVEAPEGQPQPQGQDVLPSGPTSVMTR